MAVRSEDGISPALLQAIQQSISSADKRQQQVLVTAANGQQYLVEPSSPSPPPPPSPSPVERHPASDERQQVVTVMLPDGERHVVVTSSSSSDVSNVGVSSSSNNPIQESNIVIMQAEADGGESMDDTHAQQFRIDHQGQPVSTTDYTTADSTDDEHRQLIIYNQNETGEIQTEEGGARSLRFQGPDGRIYMLADAEINNTTTATTLETSPGLVGVIMVPSSVKTLAGSDDSALQKAAADATEEEERYIAPRVDTDTEWSTYVSQYAERGPCPICTDKISGYHYGVFSCESCKGFFKRSIQNGKNFACSSCSNKGNCTIELHNRKKCAACRFAKCLAVGMKLDAVRNDRSRGGRSMYEGCSPRVPKHKTSPSLSDVEATSPAKKPRTENNSQLLSMLSQGRQVKATVPQLVTDIMNLESLLCEDDDEDIGVQENDEDLYTSLLQIADQRLYKIVRWARSLPHFAAISTDDQIALLQNAWAELLCLDCCWRSLQTPNEIKLSYTRSIDSSTAAQLGVTDIYDRVLQLRDHLQRIQMDMHEFACLKVLVLMSPDIKGLRDHARVREYQESITDAFSIYTITHYPKTPEKFGDLLLRLSEIAKTSTLCREMLNKTDLPPEVSSFSLLMELLKTQPGL